MENTDRAWIQIYSGGKFHILDPQPSEIRLEDIAHALSNLCRFTGHTKFFYSVAQHCVLTSKIVDAGFELDALLHDASEAFISDLSRPLKHYTIAGGEYLKVEANIERVIAQKFGTRHPIPRQVKEADSRMLYAEKAQLMMPLEWDTQWGDGIPANIVIEKWNPEEAEGHFLRRFSELMEIRL